MNYSLNKIRIHYSALMRERERERDGGRGKLFFKRDCPLINTECMMELKSHHFATIMEKIGLEKHHQWISNLGSKFDKKHVFKASPHRV